MSNITPYPTYASPSYQPALGGLFSWLRRTINKVANVLVQINVPFANVLVDFTNGDGDFFGEHFGSLIDRVAQGDAIDGNFDFNQSVDLPLTAAEEALLDIWVDTRFMPIYKPYLLTVKDFIENPPQVAEFNDYYNELQKFISVLIYYKQYVLSVGENGLSQNALISRNAFIDIQVSLLTEQMRLYIDSTGAEIVTYKVNVSIDKSKYASIIPSAPKVFNVTTKQIREIQTIDNTQVLISDAPIITTTPTNTPTNTQNKSYNWLLWLVAGYGTYKLFKKK